MTEQVQPQTEVSYPNSETTIALLQARFPNDVRLDDRKGYSGIVVSPEKLREVAYALRDDYSYNYLSNACAVDYLGVSDHMEMVYHAYQVPKGGPGISFKAQTNRDNPVLPSLIQVWPGADFQEREAYDLYGIRFQGHPNLTRILLWDGFYGHPMRKDWREPYFEAEGKPYDSRWPRGNVFRHEEFNPFGHNVKYPAGFTLDDLHSLSKNQLQMDNNLGVSIQGSGDDISTDLVTLNLGPQHPSTHGVFRMKVVLDGETIEDLQPVMGYMHRNHEQIGERNVWMGNFPYTDRLDYLTSMNNNLGYALTVERMLGAQVSVPYRAEVLRVLMVELNRISSHLWAIGFLLNDLGAFFTPALYALEAREYIIDVFEATAGSRLLYNYMRFGGVFKDLPERLHSVVNLINDRARDADMMDYLRQLIHERLPRMFDDLENLITDNEIVTSRCQGVGLLPPEMAVAYSTSGPLMRASGIPYDIRRADPYSIYPELEFDVAVRYNGDIYDRYMIRVDEMRQSLRIIDQLLPRLEQTKGDPIFGGKSGYSIRVPAGENYGHVDNPRGELGFYCVSTGTGNPFRYHVRGGSFVNLTALGEMCKGHKVADVVAILGSIDIVLGEVDR